MNLHLAKNLMLSKIECIIICYAATLLRRWPLYIDHISLERFYAYEMLGSGERNFVGYLPDSKVH